MTREKLQIILDYAKVAQACISVKYGSKKVLCIDFESENSADTFIHDDGYLLSWNEQLNCWNQIDINDIKCIKVYEEDIR